jgi:hypothetical protein
MGKGPVTKFREDGNELSEYIVIEHLLAGNVNISLIESYQSFQKKRYVVFIVLLWLKIVVIA